MIRFLFGVVLVSIASGCQSEKEALQVVCDAPVKCTSCMTPHPDQRVVALVRYIEDNISNSGTKKFFASLGNMEGKERATVFEKRIQEHGITSCPFLKEIKPEEAPTEPDTK